MFDAADLAIIGIMRAAVVEVLFKYLNLRSFLSGLKILFNLNLSNPLLSVLTYYCIQKQDFFD
jgi:hypothetical protein